MRGMSPQLAFVLWLMCCGVICLAICVGAKAWAAYQDWAERQAVMRRDLLVALLKINELKLENAMLRVANNMRKTVLTVRPRSRGLHLVQPQYRADSTWMKP